MSNVLLLTAASQPAADILPSLSLLAHEVRVAAAEPGSTAGHPAADAVLVDARRDLVQARALFRQLRGIGVKLPLLAIVTEGGWAAISADWHADDLILHTAGPGEVEARLRLAVGRATARVPEETDELRSGELVINEATYSARIYGRPLDLTFKEFELLKFLAHNPGRVFSRSQLLQEVWGYDYFGGTRTVDVHVRRLRAKLGAENEALIGTVRNVGYRFVPARPDRLAAPGPGSGTGPADGAGQPGGAEDRSDADEKNDADDEGPAGAADDGLSAEPAGNGRWSAGAAPMRGRP